MSPLLLMPVVTSLAHAETSLDDPAAAMPVVLTAARLKQPQSEAPASVTVIDRDLIDASGVRNLVDVLRLVPGMQVGYETGHQPSVSYHGMADENSRRLQVLVDGRSIYQPFLARILWSDQPLALYDIERIEVIRGPNSALYGANAFMAVINIITRHPADSTGAVVQTTQGNRGVEDYLARYAGQLADWDYRVSLGAQSENGFDHRADGSVNHDDRDSQYLNVSVARDADVHDRFSAEFGYKTGPNQRNRYDPDESTPYHDMDVDNGFLQLRWQHDVNADHFWHVQAYRSETESDERWQTCKPALLMSDELGALYDQNPDYTLSLIDAVSNGRALPAPAGEDLVATLRVLQRANQLGTNLSCGDLNVNLKETRSDLEFQDTIQFNDHWRVVSGLNLRREGADSQTYLGGSETNDIMRVFGNAEWRITDDWLANLGATWEHDDLIGGNISPRLAVNWHATPNQTWRAIVARAIRTPDLFEAHTDWTYTAHHLVPAVNAGRDDGRYFLRTTAPRDADEERILSREIGYYLNLPELGLEFDVKLYDDKLTDLIEGNNNFGDFYIRNNGEARLRGGEFQLDWKPSAAWRLWLAYANVDMDDLTLERNRVTAPQDSASALVQYTFDNQLSLSSAYYWMDEYLRTTYRDVDVRLAYPFSLGNGRNLKLEAIAQTRLDDSYFYDTDNNYDNDTGWYVRATLMF